MNRTSPKLHARTYAIYKRWLDASKWRTKKRRLQKKHLAKFWRTSLGMSCIFYMLYDEHPSGHHIMWDLVYTNNPVLDLLPKSDNWAGVTAPIPRLT
jgi:hypothetical protein